MHAKIVLRSFRHVAIAIGLCCGVSACSDSPQNGQESLGSTLGGGSGAFGNAGTSGASTPSTAGAGTGAGGTSGSAGASAGAGAAAGASGAQTTAGTGGNAGDLGAAGAGELPMGAPTADAGAAPSGDCPVGFQCYTDPLLMKLNACVPEGALPIPVSCATDADCAAAGLPDGLCIVEEETGLNGCLQLCTPPAAPAPAPSPAPTP